jgi:hypothetical protein
MNTCWAYNKSGNRCSLEAGHTGLHQIASTWSDDECFVPGSRPAPKPEPVVTQSVTSEQPPSEAKPCVACGHRHKGGACKCGCHTHIG